MAKKKIPGTGLIKEFKEFITRGNVVDLAVGMIIGSAFTAIVNGLVNYIFKPLINAIPLGDGVNGLRTILGDPVYVTDAESGLAVIDWTATNFIDWGSFIMAIINFLLVALVLFAIIKVINTLRSGTSKLTKTYDMLSKDEIKALRKQGKSFEEIKAINDEKAAAKAEADAEAAAAEAAAHPSTEELLKQIRDLLEAQNKK